MQLGLILNGCGGDDRDYDDEHMMVHDDDGDGDGSATDDDDVLFFRVEPVLYRCVLWLNLCDYSYSPLCRIAQFVNKTPYSLAVSVSAQVFRDAFETGAVTGSSSSSESRSRFCRTSA